MNAPVPIQETAGTDYVDPYRQLWVEARAAAIGQVRLLRRIVVLAPPEAAPFHRQLIASNTATVRAIEGHLRMTPWDGA